jgi:hypothetical protein
MFRNTFGDWLGGVRIVSTVCLFLALAPFLMAQAGGTGVLAGKVSDASGAAVASVKVTAVNADSGQTRTMTTGTDGVYSFGALPPGNYRVKFEATGFGILEIPSTTVPEFGRATVDGKLEPQQKPGEPSLGDLGFTPDQTAGSAAAQARLDKRSHMLKIHQRLGLITVAPLVATLILANGAKGNKGTSTSASASGREIHAAVGGLTAGMYLTTAAFAIFAPKVPGTATRGSIRLHKALALIHGPGMILTPILGALAYQQRSNGQKVTGIASAHGAVGAITGIAYGAAMLSVMIKF